MPGICQWFHYLDYDSLDRAVHYLHKLGCTRLRTGISWADFHRPEGRAWYRDQMRTLHAARIDALVSVWHTPPSKAEGGRCSGPPVFLDDFAVFIWEVIQEYGDYFEWMELWNEPNNRIKWNFRDYDPKWEKFARMIRGGAEIAKRYSKRTVLGGMIPVDPHWLQLIADQGGLEAMDVVAIHAFPGMWWFDHPNWDWASHWMGWDQKIGQLREVAGNRPIWVTETGIATWDVHLHRPARHRDQVERLRQAIVAPAERTYWYSLMDLDPARDCIEMTEDGRREENEYHMGLVTHAGELKPAFYEMRNAIRRLRTPAEEESGSMPASGRRP